MISTLRPYTCAAIGYSMYLPSMCAENGMRARKPKKNALMRASGRSTVFTSVPKKTLWVIQNMMMTANEMA